MVFIFCKKTKSIFLHKKRQTNGKNTKTNFYQKKDKTEDIYFINIF